MAKELPYFKFEPEQWVNGTIQMCSKETKAIFIELCCAYWARLGELPYALALQKHCNGNANELQELIKHDIILVESEQIIIEFLDEQLNEFQETSEKRRKAANKRWSDASAMQMQCKSNAIREDKIKEDKIIKENKEGLIFPFDSEEFKNAWSAWIDFRKTQHNFKYNSVSTEQIALKNLTSITESEREAIAVIEQSIANGWKGFFKIKKENGKQGKSGLSQEERDAIIREGNTIKF